MKKSLLAIGVVLAQLVPAPALTAFAGADTANARGKPRCLPPMIVEPWQAKLPAA